MSDRSTLRQNGDFRALLASFAISGAGDWMFGIALAVWSWERTHSTAWVSATVVVRYLPACASALTSGVADRCNRRRLLIVLDTTRAILLGALAAVVALHGPVVLGIVLATAVTAATSPYRAATVALMPSIVAPEDLARANALESMVGQFAFFAGPALGALLLGALGPMSVFVFDCVTYVVAAVLVAQLRPRSQGARRRDDDVDTWTAGIRAVRRDRVLTALLGLIGACVVLFGARQVLYVVVAQRLGTGSGGASLLAGASGLGALIAGFVVSRRTSSAPRWIRTATLASCLPFVLLGIAPTISTAVLILVVQGVGELTLDVATITELQQRCDEAVLGRVWGVVDSVSVTGTLVGAMLAAPLLALVGPSWTLIFLGAGAGVVCALLASRVVAASTSAGAPGLAAACPA